MTVKEIVIDWLKANKYDGLFNDECGCQINDLMPCGENCEECEPGIKAEASKESGYDFIIRPKSLSEE